MKSKDTYPQSDDSSKYYPKKGDSNVERQDEVGGGHPDSGERTYSGIALSERVVQRRDCLIQAGIKLIGTHGYHATTMRMLTAESGLSNRYFYESFEHMEDLLVACYETLMKAFHHDLEHALSEAGDALEDRVRIGVKCFFNAMTDRNFVRITHGEVLGVSARVDDLYSREMSRFAEMMVQDLLKLGNKNELKQPQQIPFVGAALVGALIYAALAWVRGRYATPMEDVVNAAVKVFIGSAEQVIG